MQNIWAENGFNSWRNEYIILLFLLAREFNETKEGGINHDVYIPFARWLTHMDYMLRIYCCIYLKKNMHNRYELLGWLHAIYSVFIKHFADGPRPSETRRMANLNMK